MRAGQRVGAAGLSRPLPRHAVRVRDQWVGVAFIAPTLFVLGALLGYPIFYNLYISLFQKHAFLPIETYVGLQNYHELAADHQFWASLLNATVYTVGTVALQIALGVGSALVLHESFAGRAFARASVLFPYVVPTIVVVILWKWMLHESYGILNHLLVASGVVSESVAWLSPRYIMLALILVSVWQFFPFVTLSLLARLQTIPPELYEAAKVDGAAQWRRFWHVTLPQLRQVLFVVVLLRGIFMFTKFDTVWLMAGEEAVGRDVQTLPVLVYTRTFGTLQTGSGASIAVVMLVLQIATALVYLRMFRRDEAL
ncbi:MAG: carbohydrate ABC transporter permease [Candidatus Rokuibacteriota bacterium]